MTHSRPTNANYKIDNVTLALLIWLHDAAKKSVKPDAASSFPDGYETINQVWIIIQNKVGWYRENSWGLNSEGRGMFAETEHYMNILKALYEPKE